jgi:O-antigen ligase
MNLAANSARGRISRPTPGGALADVQQGLPQHRTTRIERFLLLATITILPLQGYVPSPEGFSVVFIIFMMSGGYLLFRRPGTLARISSDPVFVAAYILLVLGALIEGFHPYARYSEISRIGQMFAGGIIVASLCRDQAALRTAMLGYLIGGIMLSVYAFLTSYHGLSGATATDFAAATEVRRETFKDAPFNLNWVSLVCAKGGVVALASALSVHRPHRRYLFLGITVFCAIAASLAMSRSGVMVIIVSFAAVMFAAGVWRGRTVLMAGIMGAAVVMWIPNAVWSRLTFSTETHHGRMEGRARIYKAAVEHFSEYAMTGVGSSNFWRAWGLQSNFAGHGGVIGAHNVYIQVTIYWGLAGLFSMLVVVWQAYRCLPRRCGADTLSLQLLGVSVAVFTVSLATAVIAAKDFSLVLGLLVGARRWIWPQGIVPPAMQKQRPPRPILSRMS